MSENWPIVLIEGIMIFGGALAFGWWQLHEIKRDQRIAAEKKKAATEAKQNADSAPTTAERD
jgi:predicted negative regulator of RcsB-dependent stress response